MPVKPRLCRFILLCLILPASGCSHSSSITGGELAEVRRWFILLDYEPGYEREFLRAAPAYEMVILDPDFHPPLDKMPEGMIRIAYVSVGEAEDYRFYWKEARDETWIIRENPNWNGNFYVDIRSSDWRNLLLEEILPRIIAEGFDGIMMDTLDTADVLENDFPGSYPGSRQAMISLVHEIHRRYPDLHLISNNGFSILEDIAPSLSAALVEDIYWMVDFENDAYQKVPVSDRNYKVKVLKRVMKEYGLPVFNIEYLPLGEKERRQQSLKASRKLGFRPYIAEKNLSRIYT